MITSRIYFLLAILELSFLGNYQALSVPGLSTHRKTIETLLELTTSQQAEKDQEYVQMKQWYVQKGIYKSSIKLNFHGPPDIAEGRRVMDVYDNNMFATAWVTSSLLESFRYNPDFKPTSDQLLTAIDAINAHRNMNTLDKITSIFAFWQQRFNNTVGFWASAPQNLLSCFDMLNKLPVPVIVDILKELGFNADAQILEQIRSQEDMYLSAFHIPPDFDDTFVNMGMGSILSEMKDTFAEPFNKWSGYNSDIISAMESLKKYAYRPFSSDYNVNSIDPRTYFYIRGFLDEAAARGKDVALVPTWIQNLDELRTQFYRGVAMPFSANNVDLTVAANTIFGITSGILSNVLSPDVLDDKELAQIYLNTTSLIAFMIDTNLTNRPDLALTYYPSQIEFNWFVSRTTSAIETYQLIYTMLPHPVLDQAYSILIPSLKGKMTESILSKAKNDSSGLIFFDDFLGNGDLTLQNKSLNRAEDRMFTTTMAANALIYTWTMFNHEEKQCTWKYDVPAKVKSTVEGCIGWLERNILSRQYDPWNAFFSGSVKGRTTFPFFYPDNLREHLNGSKVEGNARAHGDRTVMSGYVTKEAYDAMLQERMGSHEQTPMEFHGYNNQKDWFPFWSSEAYTYSTAMVALSRYDIIVEG